MKAGVLAFHPREQLAGVEADVNADHPARELVELALKLVEVERGVLCGHRSGAVRVRRVYRLALSRRFSGPRTRTTALVRRRAGVILQALHEFRGGDLALEQPQILLLLGGLPGRMRVVGHAHPS